MKNFRCYQIAKDLYKQAQLVPLKGEPKDQLIRATLSVCLNLVEGSARPTQKDRRRFFYTAEVTPEFKPFGTRAVLRQLVFKFPLKSAWRSHSN